jgi:hypothetical protein
MSVGASVFASFDIHTDNVGLLGPLPKTQRKGMKPGLCFKVIEFDHFKPRIIKLFPGTQKFEGCAVAYPILDNIC